MRRFAFVAPFFVALVTLAACKHLHRVATDAGSDASTDAAAWMIDADLDATVSLARSLDAPPKVPVIDFTPDASASPEDRKRALASLLAGASPAGNLEEEATDPDAGFAYNQLRRLTHEQVEASRVGLAAARLGDATSTVPIAERDRVLAGLRPRFRSCYQTGLDADPTMSGKLTLTAKVHAAADYGEVVSVEVTQNTGLSPGVAQCASGVLKRAAFAKPSGANEATLTVPLTYAPEK